MAHFALRNGPYCVVKEPVSQPKTAHFANPVCLCPVNAMHFLLLKSLVCIFGRICIRSVSELCRCLHTMATVRLHLYCGTDECKNDCLNPKSVYRGCICDMKRSCKNIFERGGFKKSNVEQNFACGIGGKRGFGNNVQERSESQKPHETLCVVWEIHVTTPFLWIRICLTYQKVVV